MHFLHLKFERRVHSDQPEAQDKTYFRRQGRI